MPKITPFLWFNDNAEEAVNYYVSLFPNSRIKDVTRYDKASAEVSKRPEGSIMTLAFDLDGKEFIAINGGPVYEFSGAVSFVVECKTQEEIDRYWDKLSEGGKPIQCGWLTDKFGLTWQIVPTILYEYLKDKDSEKVSRVAKAIQKMVKFDINALEEAYQG